MIAPMIGNSQMLNLPVSDVIIIRGGDSYTVPDGKILQFVSANLNSNGLPVFAEAMASFPTFSSTSSQYGNPVFPAGTIIDNNYYNYTYKTFVLYDLEAQNLAYNVPKQTTPTLYPTLHHLY